jgi:hypothetical protein
VADSWAYFGGVNVAVFLLVSALAKAASYRSTLVGLGDYGVRGTGAHLLARTLPIAEFLVAFGILVGPWPIPAELFGVFLVAAFTVALVVRLIAGRAGQCHCFGSLYREQVSWLTVGRNTTLIGLLVLAIRPALTTNWGFGLQARPGDLLLTPISQLVPTILIAGAAMLAYIQVVRILGLEEQDDSASETTHDRLSATTHDRLVESSLTWPGGA